MIQREPVVVIPVADPFRTPTAPPSSIIGGSSLSLLVVLGVLPWCPDREVIAAVAVEISGGQRDAGTGTGLTARDRRAVEELRVGRAQTGRRAVQHRERVLAAVCPDGQVGIAVPIEIARRQRCAEAVKAVDRALGQPGRTDGDGLRRRAPIHPGRGAVDQVHPAGRLPGVFVGARRAGGQVRVPVAVEVARHPLAGGAGLRRLGNRWPGGE